MKEEIKKRSDREYKILYLCDDSRGLSCLISKKLNLSKRKVENTFLYLTKKGLLIPGENLDEWGDRWHYTTEKGKRFLKTYANKFGLDYDF